MLTLNDGRNELWQWDTGRKIAVDVECSQVHFSNKVFGRSIDVDVVDGVASIPDILLQTDKELTAWAFVGTAENGYTKISKTFKVNRRNKPADYVFTPPEQTTLAEIVERIDDLEAIQDPDAIKNAVDDYLANNPIMVEETDPTVPDWAKEKEKPKYTADEVGALSKTDLSSAVNDALALAKASGEFDGQPGEKGEKGDAYVLTGDDKEEIAELAAGLVDVPKGGGHVVQDTPPEDTSLLWIDPSDNSGGMPNPGGNADYVLPVGGDELGGVKNGGNVVINADGTMTAPENTGSSGGTAVAPVFNCGVAVKSVNHRGYNTVAPENTIPAFILSAQNGFEFVECDVSFTSDGVCVLLHDSTIDRTSNGSGAISSMTYAEAAQYDYGSWKSADYAGTHLPTLHEFLTVCKALKLHPYIEIKGDSGTTQAMVKSIVSTVKATGMRGRVSYISFTATYLGYVKAVDPYARLGYVVNSITSTVISTTSGLKTGSNDVFVDCKYSAVTTDAVALCIGANLPLEVWTANAQSLIEEMNPYISGVTSDSLVAEKVLYDKYSVYVAPDVPVVPDVPNVPDEPDEPEKTLTSISAAYNGGDVAVGTAVTALSGVVVTAHYSDGSTETVTGYTLSGTIAEGSNIVTVYYGDMIAEFTVTGVVETDGKVWTDNKIMLSNDELVVGYRPSTSGNYMYAATNRTCYPLFDILVKPGYSYKFDFTANVDTAQIGLQFFNEYALNCVREHQSFAENDYFDPGWQESGVEIVPDAIINNSPVAGVRLTFRGGTSNPAMNNDTITTVTISRKAVTASPTFW